MFEKEIKFISDFCLNNVKGLGAFFTYEKLAATDLHPAILRYISAELDYMIYADRKKLLQQSYFDYSGKEIFQRFNEISNEIKKTKKISFEDVKKLIIQAVSFNANYVVRPKWSLTKLIYHELKYVSVDELEIMLKYIYYYDYMKNVLAAYLSKRKIVQLSATEFNLILNKIDRELFKSNSDQLIYNALKSIGDFFNIGGLDRTKVSPIAVEILLKEKNLVNYLLKLRREVPAADGAKKEYDIEEIQRILLASTPVEPGEDNVEVEEKLEGEEQTESSTPEQEFVEEEKTDTLEKTGEGKDDSIERKTLGQMADEHAAELEDSEISDFLNFEEEKLMEMYEKELKDLDEESFSEINLNETSREEIFEETVEEDVEDTSNLVNEEEFDTGKPDEQADDALPEKEIVNEMLDDYFGEQTEDEKPGEEIIEQDKVPEVLAEEDEKKYSGDSENKIDIPKKVDSLEDELLEVFEDLDEMKNEVPIEKNISEPDNEELTEFENELPEETTASELASEQELTVENEPSEMDLIDSDLEMVNETAFADDEETAEKHESKLEEKVDTGLEEINDEINRLDEETEEVEVEKQPGEEFIKRKNDLFSYMKRKEIKKIIASIFGGDEMDFVTTVEKISECATYKEATEILKGLFFSYKISPFSKEAIMFTNAVSNYFRQA